MIWQKNKDLIPYDSNPREHSLEQIEQISKSIKEFGFTIPILIDEENEIIAGHGRLLAAQALGIAEVPCLIAQGWSEEQKKAYCIADNKLTENSKWKFDYLKINLEYLKDNNFDISLLGFEDFELENIISDITPLDEFPDLSIGEKEPYINLTFTLHEEQAEVIQKALHKMKQNDIEKNLNSNINGNALFQICKEYNER